MHFFGSKISKNLVKTPENFLICYNVKIGRSGYLSYLAREIGINDTDDVIKVYRPIEENINAETLASFEGKPVTDSHPEEDVVSDNYNKYAKGHIQNVRVNDIYIVADLFITDPYLINDILQGKKREVSCGYDAVYVENNNGQYLQTKIRGNHLAVVEKGRAGSLIKIIDSRKELDMSKSTNNIEKNIQKKMKEFAKKIKDADPQEIKEIIADTSEEIVDLVADNQENLQNNNDNQTGTNNTTNNDNQENLQNNNDNQTNNVQDNNMQNNVQNNVQDNNLQNNDITKLFEFVQSINNKVDSLIAEKNSDNSPENDLNKAIQDLESINNEDEEIETNNDSDNTEDEEIETNNNDNAEETTDNNEIVGGNNEGLEINKAVNDTALQILKSTNKIIKNINNAEEKRRVVDTALKEVNKLTKKSKNNIKNIANINVKSRDAGINLDDVAQNNYDNMNPRMKVKYTNK